MLLYTFVVLHKIPEYNNSYFKKKLLNLHILTYAHCYQRWNFGSRVCDLYNSLDVHFSTVSTLHLCCIAIDRYYAIVRPLKYSTNMTVRVAAAMIGVAWTAPTLISFLPIFFGWYTTEEHLVWMKDHPDICMLKPNVPYAILSSTLTFWLPVSVMLIMYHRIYKEAQRQKVMNAYQ